MSESAIEKTTQFPTAKVNLFFHSDMARYQWIWDWLNTKGYRLVAFLDIAHPDFRLRWNSLAHYHQSAFYVNYPIETALDLDTLECFIQNVMQKKGGWYYAPRPNAYLDIEKPALVGMFPAQAIVTHPKTWLKHVAVKALDCLPGIYHQRAKQLLKTAWYHVAGRHSTHSVQPEVVLPKQLSNWHIQWQDWQPGRSILYRDLVERLSCFFSAPRGIHVILLNRCNLKCIMCPYHSPRYTPHHTSGFFEKTRMMSEEIFTRIAEYAGKYQIALQFGQIEEPLIHKKIFDFFRIAREQGVPHIHLTTNGTLLDDEKIHKLARSGIQSVMFSVDAVSPETYKAIRGKDLAQLEHTIRTFIPLAKQYGIRVTLSFIMQPQAIHEKEKFLEKWHAAGVDKITYYVLTEHNEKDGSFIRKQELYDKGTRYPCASPWVQSVVFPDGEISLCCKTMSDVGWHGICAVGNLKEQRFEEIWAGSQYKRVREELLNNQFQDFQVCSKCEIWSATSFLTEERLNYTRIYNETMESIHFT